MLRTTRCRGLPDGQGSPSGLRGRDLHRPRAERRRLRRFGGRNRSWYPADPSRLQNGGRWRRLRGGERHRTAHDRVRPERQHSRVRHDAGNQSRESAQPSTRRPLLQPLATRTPTGHRLFLQGRWARCVRGFSFYEVAGGCQFHSEHARPLASPVARAGPAFQGVTLQSSIRALRDDVVRRSISMRELGTPRHLRRGAEAPSKTTR